ncbi:histidine kinase [uncultured Bacteroides sp.]|uniref:sensor histidine kinase n=1 Tax=uncultured Bacteroides sp. TaxID=162156 RepID=UPI002AA93380|nr:histidine kinase [uncultured Bacteroides sp.]
MFELLDEKQKIRIENERLLRENLQARFEMLRQQVNPHFLFNSLATLKTMMYSDIGKAEEFIIHLSDIFRYSLKTSSDEKVLLREELSILEAYIFMLKCRFEQKLIVKINIDKKYNDFYIPPFTLQIIVENCVKHNIISNKAPLKIDIFSNEAAQLTISNSLQPKNSVETSTHVGLANIDKRYQYLCNEHIEINRENQLFKVIIPLIPNK